MIWLLVAGIALLLIYEIYAAVTNGASDPLTISQIVWRVSSRTPFLPFMFGVLMGHFFAR